jgi:tRNA (Thr-GGU) A37 N-methylase
VEIVPIGWVSSGRDEAVDDDWDSVPATITLDERVVTEAALQGLGDFSHVEVIYVFDRLDPDLVERGARHPRGNPEWPEVGILAQRARNRPNRLGVTRCRLVGVDGMTVAVRDLDAVTGTPVVDIKPYMSEFGPRGPVHQPGWSRDLMEGYWSANAPADTRRSYDRVARAYADELAGELGDKPVDRCLIELLSRMCGEGTMADLGAGPAQAAAHLSSVGAQVVASDLSPEMCRQAARRFGIESVAGDLTDLPFRAGALAGLTCFYAVIHLDRQQRAGAYREMARVLRPGGSALISFHTADSSTVAGGTVTRTEWWEQPVDLRFRFLDPLQESDALRDAGLDVTVHLDRAPAGSEHPSRRSYLLARAGT